MLITNYKQIWAEGLAIVLQDYESGEYVLAYGPKGSREEILRTNSRQSIRTALVDQEYDVDGFDAVLR